MKVLVDTSVWVDYLRAGDQALAEMLTHENVLMHSMIIGELACGNLKDREGLMEMWKELPVIPTISDTSAVEFLEEKNLMGTGIGFIDIHLLAAVEQNSTILWTRDKNLLSAANLLGLAFIENT